MGDKNYHYLNLLEKSGTCQKSVTSVIPYTNDSMTHRLGRGIMKTSIAWAFKGGYITGNKNG